LSWIDVKCRLVNVRQLSKCPSSDCPSGCNNVYSLSQYYPSIVRHKIVIQVVVILSGVFSMSAAFNSVVRRRRRHCASCLVTSAASHPRKSVQWSCSSCRRRLPRQVSQDIYSPRLIVVCQYLSAVWRVRREPRRRRRRPGFCRGGEGEREIGRGVKERERYSYFNTSVHPPCLERD
jgi:hypothetical protein